MYNTLKKNFLLFLKLDISREHLAKIETAKKELVLNCYSN